MTTTPSSAGPSSPEPEGQITRVRAVHARGQCPTPDADGNCRGERVAGWLNALGPDSAKITGMDGPVGCWEVQTYGDLRRVWLSSDRALSHIKGID